MGSTISKPRFVTAYQGKHCMIEIFVDDNYNQKDYEARVTEYYELIYNKGK